MSQKPISDAREKHPHIRSYGRRRVKGLRQTRASAMDEVLPQVQLALPETGGIDPQIFFNNPKEIWLEIGFGNGEHLLQQAVDHPDINFIGCEPFMNGVASLCVGIGEKNARNIRLWPDDARILMGKMKGASVSRLFLLHPDPWPKTRHHKRRFIQTESLDEIARLLKPGAELRIATDHPALAAWILEKANFHPAFRWTAKSADDWRKPPADWPETRYGQKGLQQGRPPIFLIFQRI
jgi:tRNA (guanine-N7-)-methyltransferase